MQRIHTLIQASSGEAILATVRGEFHKNGDYPKVGDMVVFSRVAASEESQAVIESILPRKSTIVRLDQETGQSQVLVTNVDIVFIVMGLDGDFNLKRLERYLLLARQSAISAVVILNKADVATSLAEKIVEVDGVVGDVPVHVVSATTGAGLDKVADLFDVDTIGVLLGSSGAGKSTITNWLLGRREQGTQGVREGDSRGRHTTTTRQLFTLPAGGYLIDTPGMRELGVVDASGSEDSLIAQIEALALECKFSNCDHYKSAGCAVLKALEEGQLTESSLNNYYKLQRERAWQVDKGGTSKDRYSDQAKKRSQQAQAAATRKRLSQGR